MKNSLSVLLIGAAGVLAACGGSSNDSHEPPAVPNVPSTPSGVVPPSATASIQAFVSYLGSLMLSERDAPLNVDAVVPPTSETAAPLPVN